ncbi:protein ripply1 [Chanos chanos]|uniref:Protein ripply1 n=1 Tax=Chanos chanos TaxID=29144 RepID=A0A6J2WXQ1_CHACN|nr:protein ripply1-like [Chanos chanos]
MKSACLVAKQTPFVVSPASDQNTMDTRMQEEDSQAVLWRPWLVTRNDAQIGCRISKLLCPHTIPVQPSNTMADGKHQSFQHPVRLFWPKSKSYDYLYSDGEALLRNFPVQATISFYDESDSEEEEDVDECMEEEESDDANCFKSRSHLTNYN